MPYGLIGSARNAAKGASRKTREGIPQVPIEELLAQVRGPAGALAKAGQGLAGPSRSDNVIAPMPADPAMLDPMAPKPAMMRGGVNKPAGLIGGSAPMQPAAPIVPGGQTRTREQAKQAGLIGSSAPKPQGGFLEMFGYDPEGTGMQPLDWLFSSREDVEAARGRKAAQEQKQRFAASLDQLQLSPQDRVRAEMDPEGFFRGMNEANAAQMKPQTETFYDPVSRQWMRKPLGPMAVAKGTDLVDPETQRAIYSNEADPEPIKYGFENFDGSVWAVNPNDPTDRKRMGAAPAGTPAAPRATFRSLTPEEVVQAGLSPNTAAQVNELTGEIVVKGRPSSQQTGQPTEGERSAGMHVTVSLNGLKNIMDKEASGYNRAGLGEQMSTLWGENEKLYDQAAAEFIDGYLRAMTGAAATATEIDTYRKQWFPQFGDSETVMKQKAAGRLNAIRGMKSKAGRAWNPEWDGIVGQLEQQVGASPNGGGSGSSWLAKTGQDFVSKGAAGGAKPPRPIPQINVPPQAVQELMADPSSEAMAEFDEAFGAGAAEAILNGR